MKYIEIRKDKEVVQKTPLLDKAFQIGRLPASDIVLSAHEIAPKQANLVKDRDQILIFNLGKTGDVTVNDRAVRSTVLEMNDIVQIKDYTLRFIDIKTSVDDFDIHELKAHIHSELIKRLELNKVSIEKLKDEELWKRCDEVVDEAIRQTVVPDDLDLNALKRDILNEALALGPLEQLLADDSVTEIMVNGSDKVYVERKGKLELTPLTFTNDESVVNTISRIVNPIGRRIDESMPMVDARLKDGSRVNAIIHPLSIHGPSITIRKFAKSIYTTKILMGYGALTQEMSDFMEICVQMRKNTIISGGTGSGKTSLLNALSCFIPQGERVVTIEDSAELRLPHKNMVSLEARTANIEGKGRIAIRDLVINALRMRPDRIVVGECRGGEAIDMLQAMNTGHDGSLTTIHANSPYDAVLRMETMVMMSGLDLPPVVIRRQIASAIHIVIQQARLSDGSRKITGISEIQGFKDGEVVMEEIFQFKQYRINKEGAVEGEFLATGFQPKFIDELESRGLKIDRAMFQKGRKLK